MMEILVCVAVILVAVLVIAAALSDRVLNVVVTSQTYKKAFAVHMNIFSRLYNRAVRKRKEDLFTHMNSVLGSNDGGGDVLEIGAGTGANFEYFLPGSSVVALEPNPHMKAYLLENADKHPNVHIKKVVCSVAEKMEEIKDNSMAVVVCTLTLCSVQDMGAVLTEAKRVLKPGGYFYFLEHVSDEPQTWRCKFQGKLDRVWKYFSDGCSCNRETWTAIDNAGFSFVHYEKFYLNELLLPIYLMQPHLIGYAVK